MKIEEIAEKMDEMGLGYRLVRSGAGWFAPWLWEDRQSHLCEPATEQEIRAKAMILGIEETN